MLAKMMTTHLQLPHTTTATILLIHKQEIGQLRANHLPDVVKI